MNKIKDLERKHLHFLENIPSVFSYTGEVHFNGKSILS